MSHFCGPWWTAFALLCILQESCAFKYGGFYDKTNRQWRIFKETENKNLDSQQALPLASLMHATIGGSENEPPRPEALSSLKFDKIHSDWGRFHVCLYAKQYGYPHTNNFYHFTMALFTSYYKNFDPSVHQYEETQGFNWFCPSGENEELRKTLAHVFTEYVSVVPTTIFKKVEVVVAPNFMGENDGCGRQETHYQCQPYVCDSFKQFDKHPFEISLREDSKYYPQKVDETFYFYLKDVLHQRTPSGWEDWEKCIKYRQYQAFQHLTNRQQELWGRKDCESLTLNDLSHTPVQALTATDHNRPKPLGSPGNSGPLQTQSLRSRSRSPSASRTKRSSSRSNSEPPKPAPKAARSTIRSHRSASCPPELPAPEDDFFLSPNQSSELLKARKKDVSQVTQWLNGPDASDNTRKTGLFRNPAFVPVLGKNQGKDHSNDHATPTSPLTDARTGSKSGKGGNARDMVMKTIARH